MNTEKQDVVPVETAAPGSNVTHKETLLPPNPYEDRVFKPAEDYRGKKRAVLIYPDARLEDSSDPVYFENDTSWLKKLAADLVATATAANAAGLAAIQVGENARVIAIRVSRDPKFIVLVNPSFVEMSLTDMVSVDEGCLSFPGVHEKVDRARQVKVTYQDLDGAQQEMDLTVDDPATYVAGQAVQHEYEHLDGMLLLANLNFLHRDRARMHMKQVHRKLEAIVKKTGGKYDPMQVLFGYVPDAE